LLRFLQAVNFDFEKALDLVVNHLVWRIENLPISEDSIEQYLNKGLLYLHGRDKSFRPILNISIKRICDAKIPENKLTLLATFLMEYAIENLLVPGKVETICVIADTKGASAMEIPVTVLKNAAKAFLNNYKFRIYKLFTVNVNMIMRGIWGCFKSKVEEIMMTKIYMLGSDYTEMHEQIEKSQLEKKFDGNLPNLENDYFPPKGYSR